MYSNEDSTRNCAECPYKSECFNNEWNGGCPIERGIYGPGSWGERT